MQNADMFSRADFSQRSHELARDDAFEERNAKDYAIRVTSGTTSSAPLPVIRYHSLHEVPLDELPEMKRPLILNASANAQLACTAMYPFNYPGAETALPLSTTEFSILSEAQMRDLNPDSILGFPSYTAAFAEAVPAKTMLHSIKYLLLTGELLTPSKEVYMRKHFPNAHIAMIYSTSETGYLSYPTCPHLPLNSYHPLPKVTVEALNLDENGIGDIVVSKSINPHLHIERYAPGDTGTVEVSACPCGNSTTFTIKGRRNYDVVKVAGATIIQELCIQAMAPYERQLEKYCFVAKEELGAHGPRGMLEVHAVEKPGTTAEERQLLERDMLKTVPEVLFVTPNQTLAQLVAQDIFSPLRIIWKQELPRRAKDIRLVRDPS